MTISWSWPAKPVQIETLKSTTRQVLDSRSEQPEKPEEAKKASEGISD